MCPGQDTHVDFAQLLRRSGSRFCSWDACVKTAWTSRALNAIPKSFEKRGSLLGRSNHQRLSDYSWEDSDLSWSAWVRHPKFELRKHNSSAIRAGQNTNGRVHMILPQI